MSDALLAARSLEVRFGRTAVLHGVDLEVPPGPAAQAVVGASGSGKTTLARALLGLLPAAGGAVEVEGTPLDRLDRSGRRRYRASVQPVFQDGSEALDPRMRVASSVVEGLPRGQRRGVTRDEQVAALLRQVELDVGLADRRPHQLSGGQRQRVALARALAMQPRVLVLDEPTSALDVTVQARILDLLERLRDEARLSLVLISHDLGVVDRLCTSVTVLLRGRVVEKGPTAQVLSRPAHPYTASLRAAVPTLGAARRSLAAPEADAASAVTSGASAVTSGASAVTSGADPATGPVAEPSGCIYAARCPLVEARCRVEPPTLRPVGDAQHVACHRAEEQVRLGWGGPA